MQSIPAGGSERYARCVEISKRVGWDIERDVIRGRGFDFGKKFLPDGLSKVDELHFLPFRETRLLSQIQGRTYANMIGLFERCIGAKVQELSREHWFGDQVALEALMRFTDEELKHQRLFRCVEAMIGERMPEGYVFLPEASGFAGAVLARSTWAVLALTCHVELFTQAHYRESIDLDPEVSELWNDVFLFHWKEESQHAILDELEWRRADAQLAPEQRDRGVNDFIELLGTLDAILQAQAGADTDYFLRVCGRVLDGGALRRLRHTMLKAYRWQYIGSGARDERFRNILAALATDSQMQRIDAALAPLAA